MGKLMLNGISYTGGEGGSGSSNCVTLTQAQYNELSQVEKNNGTYYYISDADVDSSSTGLIDDTSTPSSDRVWSSEKTSQEIASAVGVTTLNDLTDVSISSPTEGQILVYDSTNRQWGSEDTKNIIDCSMSSGQVSLSGGVTVSDVKQMIDNKREVILRLNLSDRKYLFNLVQYYFDDSNNFYSMNFSHISDIPASAVINSPLVYRLISLVISLGQENVYYKEREILGAGEG